MSKPGNRATKKCIERGVNAVAACGRPWARVREGRRLPRASLPHSVRFSDVL